MKPQRDNPGIFVPPPAIYAAMFLISIALQNFFPISESFLETPLSKVIGWTLIGLNLTVGLPALFQFFRAKNAVFPTEAATSLQTTGIYSFSRNPMYSGMTLFYIGLALLIGNWWTLFLVPLLITIITIYVIGREERYLERAFGQSYRDYKKQVRRWL